MQRRGWRGGISARPTFSILGRIGGDATRLRPGAVSPESTFSILGRIGGDATIVARGMVTRGIVLSVSSVGSEAMQLMTEMLPADVRRLFLSVSSVGSEAMQLIS